MSRKVNKNQSFFELCKAISSEFEDNQISEILGQLTSIENHEDLEYLLQVFNSLNSIKNSKVTVDNLRFIITKSNLLKDLFFEEGKIKKESLKILESPYDILINEFYDVAKHCLDTKLEKNISEDVFMDISRILIQASNHTVNTLEACITKKSVKVTDIADSLNIFFELHKICPAFFDNVDLNILVTTAFAIYDTSLPENANSNTYRYIRALKYCKEDPLNNIIWYLNEFETSLDYEELLEILECSKFWVSEIFESENKLKVLNDLLTSKYEYYPLMLKSPNIALKFYKRESETGEKPYFHALKDISIDICNEIEKII